MSLLHVEKLTMQFGGLTAVKEVSFDVEPGQIFSVIGPNGAGKTTVFNAITGIYSPTAGRIKFAGHELQRPLTARIWLGLLAMGLLTALAMLLAVAGVNDLWYAAIYRTDQDETFNYSAAARNALAYLRGDLTLARVPWKGEEHWKIVPAGAESPKFAQFDTKQEAEQARDELARIARSPDPAALVDEREGRWVLLTSDGARPLLHFATQAEALSRANQLAAIGRAGASGRRNQWLALLIGFVLGSAGTYSVWNRSRRTPDVIALGGIARTFQNIRLFPAMTASENVQVGLDRSLRGGFLSAVLRTPKARRLQQSGRETAAINLKFVGLERSAGMLADALPYGDQRRLEIARALAAKPRLLLLDEPAAGMNPTETVELTKLIRKIRDLGITVLLIEHHMRVVMGISDRIAVLDHGVKIAEGTPEEIRCNPKVIEAYLGKEELG